MPKDGGRTTERAQDPTGVAWLSRLIDAKPNELPALGWALLWIFSLFLAYYVLRPIRDELGVAGGVENLPWLFTGTLLAMLVASPLFASVVRRYKRDAFIAITYRFFGANLLIFAALIAVLPTNQQVWVGRAFFIWVSVFNLFVVSVFWSFAVDIFTSSQGKRLFGALAAGATLGGIVGSALTAGLVERVGPTWLIIIVIILIELAVLASRRLSKASRAFQQPRMREAEARPVGGGIFTGMIQTFRSPYLLALAGFMLIYSITSTFLYFEQANIAAANYPDRAARTAFFASIDLWVNLITLGMQVLLSGRIIASIGMIATICALPLISALGFAAIVAQPTIGVFIVAQVARRVCNFALTRPAREVLFTSSPREDRYKSKNFIDTVVYRGGDQVASWSYGGLMAMGLSIAHVAIVGIPLSLVWLALAICLGRMQRTADRKQSQIVQANGTMADALPATD